MGNLETISTSFAKSLCRALSFVLRFSILHQLGHLLSQLGDMRLLRRPFHSVGLAHNAVVEVQRHLETGVTDEVHGAAHLHRCGYCGEVAGDDQRVLPRHVAANAAAMVRRTCDSGSWASIGHRSGDGLLMTTDKKSGHNWHTHNQLIQAEWVSIKVASVLGRQVYINPATTPKPGRAMEGWKPRWTVL